MHAHWGEVNPRHALGSFEKFEEGVTVALIWMV